MSKKPVPKVAKDHKQELFIAAYLTNGNNATEAAKAAGYSERSAYNQGARLMKNDVVKNKILQHQQSVVSDLNITTERILKERARLAFFNPKKLRGPDGRPLAIHELDDDTAAAIAGIEMDEYGAVKKIRMADKNASLTALERYKGMAGQDGNTPMAESNMNHDDIQAARAIAFILARAAYYLKKSENPHQLPDPERQG